jgi:translation initiation factor 4A
VIYCFS